MNALLTRHGCALESDDALPIESGRQRPSFPPMHLRAVGRGRTVLVAGVGNVLSGDDGFGVEVAHRLLHRWLPSGVRVVDFGIRGFDLVCALDTADVAILVDAYPHGAPPGALTVIEPDLALVEGPETEAPGAMQANGLDPVSVLRLARAMDAMPKRLLVVGCQPATHGSSDGLAGLSQPVGAAVLQAVDLVESLAAELLRG